MQGSFKLGTAIRSLTEYGSYDIDIVCKLNDIKGMDRRRNGAVDNFTGLKGIL